ncbi:phage baseplate plug family protein [Acinetobacter bereziniae]|uniref:phage baseplate plug family protein n=1 Tax=Acinetobacter bereziniae TaxID=106648 RepID=UPI00190086F7|nr:hypothetical protein [Acinetobacter bereziniae]MBJ8426052.1 hypothetical protein [Acinetobacter bereziniae]MBJ9902015.1 hypothetical protein [Acinetobacter bereziniae]
MGLYKIPLGVGNQKFIVQLNKITYKLQLIFRLDCWYLDVLDSSENPIISGLAMNPNIDLLEQHQHLIKGSFFATNANKDESQGFFDLDSKIQLYWRDPT